jgi:hypothetical protein
MPCDESLKWLMGGISDEGNGLYNFVDAFHPFIRSFPFADCWLDSRR